MQPLAPHEGDPAVVFAPQEGRPVVAHPRGELRVGGLYGSRNQAVPPQCRLSHKPAKVAQADNTFAKESGATVDWRKFDSGASIVRALASGDVQIGNLGSSPLAVATSQQVPIEVFLLASKLGNSEALVVKKTISKPEDLIGKRVAVPFISI